MRANDFLFEVRFKLYRDGGHVTVRAFDTYRLDPQTGHSYLRCELVFNGKKIFSDFGPVGIPSHQSIDGESAKESVVGWFCLKPGDTDQDFFADYTEEQLQFVTEHGEALYCAKCNRWGWDG